MKVLIAFDKFKDSMNAKTACVVAANTLHKIHPGWEMLGTPLTDGGDGFCEIMTEALGGGFHPLPILGPRFQERTAVIGLVELERLPARARQLLELPSEGRLAIIEMAQASGLEALPTGERDCRHTSSYGTGEMLAFVIEQGVEAILLGVGGSATSDLGLGALEAMGLQVLDAEGRSINRLTPADWSDVHRFAGSLIHPAAEQLPPIRIACDVRNPLFGSDGAAAVFGPQKGLRPEDLPYFEAEGQRLAELLTTHCGSDPALTGLPGAGAAGGIGFGLMAAAGARLVPGFELVSAWLRLEEQVADADIILTGEGKFDESSLHGKGPFAVMEMAEAAGSRKEVHLFAGAITVSNLEALQSRFAAFSATAIANPDWSLQENLACGPDRLAAAISGQFTSQ